MIRTLSALAVLGSAAALASCAPTPEPGADVGAETLAGLDTSDQRVFKRAISSYSEAPDGPSGNERIFVRTRSNERFVLESPGSCRDIDFALQIGLEDRFGPRLCTGDLTSLTVPTPFGSDRCQVRVIGRIEGPVRD